MRYALVCLFIWGASARAASETKCGKIERVTTNFNASPVMVDVALDSGATVAMYVDAVPTLTSAMAGNLTVCLNPQSQRFLVSISR